MSTRRNPTAGPGRPRPRHRRRDPGTLTGQVQGLAAVYPPLKLGEEEVNLLAELPAGRLMSTCSIRIVVTDAGPAGVMRSPASTTA